MLILYCVFINCLVFFVQVDQRNYVIIFSTATMDTGGSAPPLAVGNFSVLKHSEYYQDSAENVLLSQRFLLCANTAYIYNKNTVLCVSGKFKFML